MQRFVETERIAHAYERNAGRRAKIAQHTSHQLVKFAFVDHVALSW